MSAMVQQEGAVAESGGRVWSCAVAPAGVLRSKQYSGRWGAGHCRNRRSEGGTGMRGCVVDGDGVAPWCWVWGSVYVMFQTELVSFGSGDPGPLGA